MDQPDPHPAAGPARRNYNLAPKATSRVIRTPPIHRQQRRLGPRSGCSKPSRIRRPGEKKTRFYQASTSELYCKSRKHPSPKPRHSTPRSPYGVAKPTPTGSRSTTAKPMACLPATGHPAFNHESPLPGETFVTRKITARWPDSSRTSELASTSATLRRPPQTGPRPRLSSKPSADAAQGEREDFVIASRQTTTPVRDLRQHRRRRLPASESITGKGRGSDQKAYIIPRPGRLPPQKTRQQSRS